MKEQIFWFLAAAIYLAILYMLVRPGSTGPAIVTNVLNALSDLVKGSIGYSYDSSTGKWNSPS